MFEPLRLPENKPEFYSALQAELASLLDTFWLTNLSNMSSLLFHRLPDVNWAGFYLLRQAGEQLVLGPFQGKPACLTIPLGKGVCGKAAQTRQMILVEDVNLFPGHIACDSASRSEIVIPLIARGRLLGVLDIDSPSPNRFDQADRIGLEKAVHVLIEKTEWPEKF